MRIAVTGAGGRLGAAVVRTGGAGGHEMVAWTRSDFDLDAPDRIDALLDVVRPDLVVHAAAWTDVDGCARDPDLALARNGVAAGTVADACASRGASMVLVSTNEVFDGTRSDRRPYGPEDPTNPANPYGASKLEGERVARAAFEGSDARLAIARTAWLFGAGKPDFPARIAAVARQAASEGRPLRVVADEIGTPTYVGDLAEAVIRVATTEIDGVLHLVNDGIASRAEWARDVLARLQIKVDVEDVSLDDYVRPSRPPRWGVLQPSSVPGAPMRHWRDAMGDRMAMGGFDE